MFANTVKTQPGLIIALPGKEKSVAEEGGKAVIRIADSGAPLPDGVDIFKPFVTENTARTVGQGTGLGLAVTKRVIESHRGAISVESAAPDFTKMFVIRL